MSGRCALIMAGGTGGHIFPGLAVAQALRTQGWRVHWLGAPDSMESQIIPPHGFPFETIHFSGLRGKGWTAKLLLPARLLRAFWQSLKVIMQIKPDVLVGLGGYITFPGSLMGVMLGKPLVLHEQNAIAGMSNRFLSAIADRVMTAFPGAIKKAVWVGNPLRDAFASQPAPEIRFASRTGPMRLLVVGGSLGAKALNEIVPQGLARIPAADRPVVLHQGGARQIDALRGNYARAGVAAELVPFIENTAQAFADADLIICRAGASTVTEVAAIGAAAVFVPFPFAVDDHQTANARFLVDQGGGWVVQQTEFNPEALAHLLQTMTRADLLKKAQKAWAQRKLHAAQEVVRVCEELAR